MRTLACALLLLSAAGAANQREIIRQACARYQQADTEMNQAYSQVLKDYAADALFLAKFRAAQRAWLAFRDAHLAAVYPKSAPGAYGSVNAACRCGILAQLTNERTAQLRDWLEGTQEGDVCAGSIRINK